MSAWRQLAYAEAAKPEELSYGEPPEVGVRVWNIFNSLSNHRNSDEAGPKRIAYSDISAYTKLFKVDLFKWELDAILELDNAFIKVWIEKE